MRAPKHRAYRENYKISRSQSYLIPAKFQISQTNFAARLSYKANLPRVRDKRTSKFRREHALTQAAARASRRFVHSFRLPKLTAQSNYKQLCGEIYAAFSASFIEAPYPKSLHLCRRRCREARFLFLSSPQIARPASFALCNHSDPRPA